MNPDLDLNLFGRPLDAVPDRFAAGMRSAPKPWSAAEDLCLWPVLLACDSQRAYLAACEWVLGVLGRPPKLPGRPSRPALVVEAQANTERRTVTDTMVAAPPLWEVLYQGLRTGLPLTWGEERMIWQWTRKPDNNSELRIGFDVLCGLLERGPRDDVMVDAAVARLGKLDEFVRPERLQSNFDAPALETALRAFLADPETVRWADLHETARSCRL